VNEDDKTLEEGYESLAAALRVKQEWQRKVLDLVGPLKPGEHLDAVLDRIRELIASRQAWAEEAMRLELTLASRLCTGDHACLSPVHVRGCFYSDVESPEHPQYDQAEVSRPQCTVHPEMFGSRPTMFGSGGDGKGRSGGSALPEGGAQ
jgi:hypothetical protein